MEVDVADVDMGPDVGNAGEGSQAAGGRAAPRGRAARWAVSLQPVTSRPAACKSCGDGFDSEELRICTWGDRKTCRWIHPLCCTAEPASVTTLSPVGGATEVHAASVRALWRTRRNEAANLSEDAATEQQEEAASQHAWQNSQLPGKEWWERLDWDTLLRASQQTYVQVPDRLRGALATARGKLLEVLDKAEQEGDGEAEWKALLAFDLLLVARHTTTCAETLEERLPLWWGGQWEALWTAAVRSTPSPPPRSAATNRQQAKRVHTLAAAGEEGRALSAASSSKLAPRTP
jgi:hypothetical protein